VDNEIVFAGDMPSQTISDMVRRGDLRPLARGICTTDTSRRPEAVVARHWLTIVGHDFPDAVITDRSALTGGKVGGYLYLSRDGRPREFALPIKALRFLHDYTVQIDGTTHATAEADLRSTYAFEETDDAPRLRLLRPVPPA
jgi:hypothetical protein